MLTSIWFWIISILVLVAIRDVFFQKKHSITHNFPIVGHLRYWLEKIGPEIRQYIVANNREELPFNRQERSWIYASSKKDNNLQGFGSDQDFNAPGYIFIKNAMIGYNPPVNHPYHKNSGILPAAKIMGEYHQRKRPYRPYSIINISGMSFGALSAKAIESLNKGADLAGCFHNTGETVGKGTGHFIGAMRIDAFRPAIEFKKDMDIWIQRFRNAEAVEGQKVIIPGDPERALEVERKANGIPLIDPVVEDLKALSVRFNLDIKIA